MRVGVTTYYTDDLCYSFLFTCLLWFNDISHLHIFSNVCFEDICQLASVATIPKHLSSTKHIILQLKEELLQFLKGLLGWKLALVNTGHSL